MSESKPERVRGQKRPRRTDEARLAILRAVRAGCSLRDAARCGGVSPATLATWRNEDPEFSDAIEVERVALRIASLEQIEKASRLPENWKAAAWMLERLWPDEYGRSNRIELTGKSGGAILVASKRVEDMTDAELDNVIAGCTQLSLPGDVADHESEVV